jgi:hypothetical protein
MPSEGNEGVMQGEILLRLLVAAKLVQVDKEGADSAII